MIRVPLLPGAPDLAEFVDDYLAIEAEEPPTPVAIAEQYLDQWLDDPGGDVHSFRRSVASLAPQVAYYLPDG